MSYLFNTSDNRRQMLDVIGAESIDALFEQVPADVRLNRDLDLPAPLSELELQQLVSAQAVRNVSPADRRCFLGGGAYDHFVPAAVDAIVGRSEFYTAYTPYQAEASQGSLQAFFEYQTLICQLTGMEVSNASLYEGGTAVSEAVFMAMRVTRRHDRIVLAGSLNPQYQQVVRTYLLRMPCEVVVVPAVDGVVDPTDVARACDERTACVVLQHPNFFGCLEDMPALVEAIHKSGALVIQSFDPVSLGLLKRPGDLDVDIAVAEGQGLGIPLQYGGPYLGILACREKFVRQMPGRLIGETVDRNGRRCFVLNLQAREQHIRREKATSNICTNQGLLALRATVHLSLLGPQGLQEVAGLSFQKAHYAALNLSDVDGIELAFDRPFFKEFTIRCRDGAEAVIERARQEGVDIGPSLTRAGIPGMEDCVLVAVTESRTRDDIDHLVRAVE